MKDNKLTTLIIVSILLLIVSIAAVSLFGYNYLYGNNENKSDKPVTNTVAEIKPVTPAVTQPSAIATDTSSVSDSAAMKAAALNTWNEYNKLRDQVLTFETERNDSEFQYLSVDVQVALQKRLEALRLANNLPREDTKKYQGLLNELSHKIQNLQTGPPPTKPKKDTVAKVPKKEVTDKANLTAGIAASDMQMIAVRKRDDGEKETSSAEQTDEIICSAWLENNSKFRVSKDVVAEVTQPGGKVISRQKLHFEAKPGEIKKIKFSLTGKKYKTGRYGLQLLYNKEVIGIAGRYLQ